RAGDLLPDWVLRSAQSRDAPGAGYAAVMVVPHILARVVISNSMVYVILLKGSGRMHLRRVRASLGVQGHATYGSRDARATERLGVYSLVPCLNEDAVIGQPVSALTLLDGTTTLVIDDGSDDDTARCAEEAGGDRVRVLRRVLPEARKGKGEALNNGIAWVREDVAARGLDPGNVVVCVMDADGRLSDHALDHVLPLFEDENVGGV